MNNSGDCSPLPASGSTTPTTRSRIEALSRDELVQRCKSLLAIAHKAKLAKDEALKEATALKQKLFEAEEAQQQSGANGEQADTERAALRADLERQTALAAGLQSRLQQQSELVAALQSELDTQSSQTAGALRSATRLEEENDELLSKLDQLDERRRAAEARVAATQEDLLPFKEMADTFKARWCEALEELATLKTERDALATKLEPATADVTNGNNGVLAEAEEAQRMGTVWEELQTERARSGQLEMQLQERTYELTMLKEKFDAVVSGTEDGVQRCAELERRCEESAAKVQKLVDTEAALQRSLHQLHSENERLLEANTGHQSELEELAAEKVNQRTASTKIIHKLIAHLHRRDIVLKKLVESSDPDEAVTVSTGSESEDPDSYDCDAALQTFHQLITSAANERKEYSVALADLQESRTLLQKHNTQLLQEMNDMNEALKERGGTISRLEEELSASQKTFEEKSQVLKDQDIVLEQTQTELEAAQKRLSEIAEELVEAKSQINETTLHLHLARSERDATEENLNQLNEKLEEVLSTISPDEDAAKIDHNYGQQMRESEDSKPETTCEKTDHLLTSMQRIVKHIDTLRNYIESNAAAVSKNTEGVDTQLKTLEKDNQLLLEREQSILQEKEQLEEVVRQLGEERDALKEQRSEQEASVSCLQTNIDAQREEENVLRTELAKLKTSNAELVRNLSDMENDNAEPKSSSDASLEAIEEELNAAKSQIAEAQTERDTTQENLGRISEKLMDALAAVSQSEQVVKMDHDHGKPPFECDDAEPQTISGKSKHILTCVQKLIDHVVKLNDSLETKAKTVSKSIDDAVEERRALEVAIRDLHIEEEKLKDVIDNLKTSNDELVNKLSNLESCNTELRSSADDDAVKNKRLQKLFDENKVEISKLQIQLEQLEDRKNKEISELTSSNEANLARITDLENHISERSAKESEEQIQLQKDQNTERANLSQQVADVLQQRDDLRDQVIELESQVETLRGQSADLKLTVDDLRDQCAQKEVEGVALRLEVKSLNEVGNQLTLFGESLAKVEAENKVLIAEVGRLTDVNEELASWKNKFAQLEKESSTVSKEKEVICTRVAELETGNVVAKEQLETLQKENRSIEEQLIETKNDRDLVKAEVISLTAERDELIAKCAQFDVEKSSAAEVQRKCEDLEARNTELQGEHDRLSSERTSLRSQMSAHSDEVTKLQSQLSAATSESASVRAELSAVTGALTAAESRLSDSAAEVKTLTEHVTTLQQELAAAETRPAARADENSRTHLDQSETQSEALSTSTALSRAEDASRMRDVEDSIEERYHKLRSLAVKLKKRVAQLQQQLTAESEQRQSLQAELERSRREAAALRLPAQNVQALQASCDQLQDQLDAVTSRERVQQRELTRAAEQLAEARGQLASVSEERDTAAAQSKALTERVGELEQLLVVMTTDKSALEAQCTSAQETLDKERRRAADAETNTAELQAQLAELTKERDQHSAASGQLQQLQEQLQLAEQQLQEAAAGQLRAQTEAEAAREQLRVVTEELERANERAVKLQASVRDGAAEVEAAHGRQAALQVTCDSVRADADALSQENDGLRLGLADATRTVGELNQTQTTLRRQVTTLETRAASLQADLAASKAEQQTLRTEFDQYKLRAKAVLKKAQVAQRTADADEEREALRCREERIDALQRERDQIRQEALAAAAERDTLQQEVQRLQERTRRLIEQAADADVRWRQQIEKMRVDNSTSLAEKEASLQALQRRLGTDRPPPQLTDAEAAAQRAEVASLRAELLTAREELSSLQHQQRHLSTQAAPPGGAGVRQKSPPSPIDVTSMEREAAEGSENVTPQPLPSRHSDMVPLERLLSFNDDALSVTSQATELTSTERERLASVEGDLVSSRRNEAHLSSLLNESEASNAKLSQLCDALKAEIRRSERSEERQKHLNQMEYLKNVIVKFLALKAGDERVRLVPVLATMLRLTPDEVTQMNQVASGGDVPGKEQHGWGSYLHLWSGGST